MRKCQLKLASNSVEDDTSYNKDKCNTPKEIKAGNLVNNDLVLM